MADISKKLSIYLAYAIFAFASIVPCHATDTNKDSLTTASLIQVLKFYVVADGNPKFLNDFCKATEIPITKTSEGKIKAGPFISAFEAGWLCMGTPFSEVTYEDNFNTASKKELEDLRKYGWESFTDAEKQQADGETPTTAGILTVGPLRLVKMNVPQGCDVYSENCYVVDRKNNHGLIYQMQMFDFYQESWGLAVLDRKSSPLILSIEGGCRGTLKTEPMLIRSFENGILKEIKECDFTDTFQDFSSDSNRGTIFVSRLFLDKNALKIRQFPVDYEGHWSFTMKNTDPEAYYKFIGVEVPKEETLINLQPNAKSKHRQKTVNKPNPQYTKAD